MNIGLDFDDVIAHFFQELLEFYNKKNNKSHSLDDMKEYDMWVNWGITKDEAMQICNEFHENQQPETTKPIEHAVESIINLFENGDKLYIITARHPRFKNKVEDWISHHLQTRRIRVITTRDHKVGEYLKKSKICKDLKVDIMLEDSGENALDCAKEGIKVILFNKPWNQNISHENIIRVENWKEAIDKIRYLDLKLTTSLQKV